MIAQTNDLPALIQARYEANILTLDKIVAANWRNVSIAGIRQIAQLECKFPFQVSETMIWASRQRLRIARRKRSIDAISRHKLRLDNRP